MAGAAPPVLVCTFTGSDPRLPAQVAATLGIPAPAPAPVPVSGAGHGPVVGSEGRTLVEAPVRLAGVTVDAVMVAAADAVVVLLWPDEPAALIRLRGPVVAAAAAAGLTVTFTSPVPRTEPVG